MRFPRTGMASRTRSGAGWTATGVRSGCGPAPARAPRCTSRCRGAPRPRHARIDEEADGVTESTQRRVRVFLVDDHALFRAGVRTELDSITDEIEVVGEAGTVGEAVAGIAAKLPDVVLLDVHM